MCDMTEGTWQVGYGYEPWNGLISPKLLTWSWSPNTLAAWCEEPTRWKRPWCWERWKAGGEGDDRGWDGWLASATQWAWVWARSMNWWWTGKPSVLWSMGSQRVGLDWATELNCLELREGHGSWMKPISCNQDQKDFFCPGVPQGPALYHTQCKELWKIWI